MCLSTRSCLAILCSFLSLAVGALAECAPPSSPGVRICSPTPDALVVYGRPRQISGQFPFLDFNSTPASGAHIVKIKAYSNNGKFFEGADFQSGATLMDETTSGLFNGVQNVIINAWDSDGNLFQGRVSFRVVGDGFRAVCAFPSDPGVNICSPSSDGVLSTRVAVSASATPKTGEVIRAIKLYADNAEQVRIETNGLVQAPADTETQGNHNITVVAWDSKGNVYKSSRIIKSTYTYDWSICDPHGENCLPGFNVRPVPAPNDYVGNAFRLQASIEQNPAPITGMKAYIGNNLVASSNGPTLIADLSNVPSGTQKLTLQAWDTSGVLYRVQYNLNVNLSH